MIKLTPGESAGLFYENFTMILPLFSVKTDMDEGKAAGMTFDQVGNILLEIP